MKFLKSIQAFTCELHTTGAHQERGDEFKWLKVYFSKAFCCKKFQEVNQLQIFKKKTVNL